MKTANHSSALEMTTFKLSAGKDYRDFISANEDVDAWLKKQPGFRTRLIAQRPDGTIIDALVWDAEEYGTDAMQRLMSELSDSPVHDLIDQSTVSWNIFPLHHQVSVATIQ